jgi:hypothetical protein
MLAFGGDDIYTVNADGSDPRQRTNNPAMDRAPAWSPDGTKIAFTRDVTGEFQHEIFVMNANGTNPAPLTTDGGSDPDWQPLQIAATPTTTALAEPTASPAPATPAPAPEVAPTADVAALPSAGAGPSAGGAGTWRPAGIAAIGAFVVAVGLLVVAGGSFRGRGGAP